MNITHRAAIAALFAVSAAGGAVAVTQTVHLGADARRPAHVSHAQLVRQHAALRTQERSIHRALAATPPALPKVPHYEPLPEHPVAPPLVVTRVVRVGGSDTATATSAAAPTSTRTATPTPPPTRRGTTVPATTPTPAPVAGDGEDHGEHHDTEQHDGENAGHDGHDD